MTASISNRKRSREDGNSEDHMPLSKRINKLHIDNNCNGHSQNQHQHGHNNITASSSHHEINYVNGITNGNYNQMLTEQNHQHEPHHHRNHNHQNGNLVEIASSHVENNNTYSPELNQVENPYYYNKNKLLFELHIERSKRHTSDKI